MHGADNSNMNSFDMFYELNRLNSTEITFSMTKPTPRTFQIQFHEGLDEIGSGVHLVVRQHPVWNCEGGDDGGVACRKVNIYDIKNETHRRIDEI